MTCRRFAISFLTWIIVALLSLSGAIAQTQVAAPTAFLSERLSAASTLDNYLKNLQRSFRELDADGDGVLTAADRELHAVLGAVGPRAFLALDVLGYDLDGDSVVTVDEIRRLFKYQRRTQGSTAIEGEIEAEVRRLMAADADRNGVIDLKEAYAHVQTQAEALAAQHDRAGSVQRMLALDANGDGQVTLAEVEASAEAMFRSIDTDGNGVISKEEVEAYRKEPPAPSAEQRQAAEERARRRESERRAV
jgi:Ca2+-binding EF-hand superfamily protein